MNAVLRAEIRRLRTVRAPYLMVLVVLVAVVSNAIPLGLFPETSDETSPAPTGFALTHATSLSSGATHLVYEPA